MSKLSNPTGGWRLSASVPAAAGVPVAEPARAAGAGAGADAVDGQRHAVVTDHAERHTLVLALSLRLLQAGCAALALGLLAVVGSAWPGLGVPPSPAGTAGATGWGLWQWLWPAVLALWPARAMPGPLAQRLNRLLLAMGLLLRAAATALVMDLLWGLVRVQTGLALTASVASTGASGAGSAAGGAAHAVAHPLQAWLPVLSPGPLLALWLVYAAALLALLPAWVWWARRWQRPLRLVVVGADARGRALAAHLMAQAPGQVQVLGFVDDRLARVRPDELPAPFLGPARGCGLSPQAVDGFVIALPPEAGARVHALAALLRRGLVDLYVAPALAQLHDPLLGRAGGALAPLMLLGAQRPPMSQRVAKRLFDIAFSAGALLLFLPLGLLIAAAIKLESPGPVFFSQPRYGLGGRLFPVYKFRSMRHDPVAARGPIRLTERGDPRVTRLGAWLRQTSLDEFPQFLNVLLGHMSVVGPRPHPPGVKAGNRVYEEVVADFMARYKVRPGLTGWAQVNGLRGNTFTEDDITQRFAYDMQYLRHTSLPLDLLIVLKTVFGGFGGRNAF